MDKYRADATAADRVDAETMFLDPDGRVSRAAVRYR